MVAFVDLLHQGDVYDWFSFLVAGETDACVTLQQAVRTKSVPAREHKGFTILVEG